MKKVGPRAIGVNYPINYYGGFSGTGVDFDFDFGGVHSHNSC
jgi:hypothetical protein